jgi:hypothetical protein
MTRMTYRQRSTTTTTTSAHHRRRSRCQGANPQAPMLLCHHGVRWWWWSSCVEVCVWGRRRRYSFFVTHGFQHVVCIIPYVRVRTMHKVRYTSVRTSMYSKVCTVYGTTKWGWAPEQNVLYVRLTDVRYVVDECSGTKESYYRYIL